MNTGTNRGRWGETRGGIRGRTRSAVAQWRNQLWLALVVASAAMIPAGAVAQQERLTAIAQILAGVQPTPDDPAFDALLRTDAWRQHREASRAGAAKVRSRIERMQAWQSRSLPEPPQGATLVYPFSGPDLINAIGLFPDYDTYVFFSLEPPGGVPHLTKMNDAEFAHLLSDLRFALNDVVQLNFFITPNMKDRMQTDSLHGVTPVLLSMMGMLQLQVTAVETIDPWPERSAALRQPDAHKPPQPMQAIRIDFSNPRTGHKQTLYYYSLDVSDRALAFYPEFTTWLRQIDNPAVLLKSASYLLHGGNFDQVRDFIRDRAVLLVQDDTGMPYRTLRNAGFALTLHGQYEKPVKLFENRYQKDLDDAFAATADRASLPFPFGYNWRKGGRSGLIVARREQPSS
jgi:hypothetical protein